MKFLVNTRAGRWARTGNVGRETSACTISRQPKWLCKVGLFDSTEGLIMAVQEPKKKASTCSTTAATCKVHSDSVIIIIAALRHYNGSSFFAFIWPERAEKLGKTQHVGPELLSTANLVALICNQQMSVLPCFPSVVIFYEDDYSPSKLSGTLLFIFERLQ